MTYGLPWVIQGVKKAMGSLRLQNVELKKLHSRKMGDGRGLFRDCISLARDWKSQCWVPDTEKDKEEHWRRSEAEYLLFQIFLCRIKCTLSRITVHYLILKCLRTRFREVEGGKLAVLNILFSATSLLASKFKSSFALFWASLSKSTYLIIPRFRNFWITVFSEKRLPTAP